MPLIIHKASPRGWVEFEKTDAADGQRIAYMDGLLRMKRAFESDTVPADYDLDESDVDALIDEIKRARSSWADKVLDLAAERSMGEHE